MIKRYSYRIKNAGDLTVYICSGCRKRIEEDYFECEDSGVLSRMCFDCCSKINESLED